MTKLKRVLAELDPHPGVQLNQVRFDLPSFHATVDGHRVELVPIAPVELDVEGGAALAKQEIAALLAVLGCESDGPVYLQNVTAEAHVEDSPGQLALRETVLVSDALNVAVIPGPETQRRLQERVKHAATDPFYRELLGFMAIARAAANPRPVVFNILERLEKKFGGRKALQGIGISENSIKRAVKNQDAYEGDRHAKHAVGTARPSIPATLKAYVLGFGAKLIAAYEKYAKAQPTSRGE